MENLERKIISYMVLAINILFAFMVGYLFFMSLFNTGVMAYTDQHIFFLKDFPMVLLVGMGLMICLIWWLKQRKNLWLEKWTSNKVQITLTVIWAVLLIFWICSTIMPPFHDQFFVFQISKQLMQGDYSAWEIGGYMQMYPFQASLALLYVPFHFLFRGNAILCIELFNGLCYLGIAVLFYKMIREEYGNTAAALTYDALLFFFPAWGYITFVYGTVPGLFFSCLAFFLCRKYGEEKGRNRRNDLQRLAGIALCLCMAVLWKNNYVIFAIAVFLWLGVTGIIEKTPLSLLGSVLVLAGWQIATSGILLFFHHLTGQITTDGIPYIGWMAMGLRDSSIAPGWYNRFTEMTFEECGYSGAGMKPIAMQELQKNLAFLAQEKAYAVSFWSRKVNSMWNSPLFESTVLMAERNCEGTLSYPVKDLLYNGGIGHTLLLIWFDFVQSIIYGGALLLAVFRVRDWKNAALTNTWIKGKGLGIEIITVLGGFLFHLGWEAKCQYAFPYFMLLIPVSVMGWKHFIDAENKKRILLPILIGIFIGVGCTKIDGVNPIKLGTDTSDYVWYCQNQTEWKNEEYHWSNL